ncbi:putative lipid II flippase MurJ [Clostridia bacterium]|nr:putative lipid II flippase MurJ [Clostridia bacterium]GHU75498.1 putative lipid II flippase MurJ [Clostridia bacterium]
MQNKKKSSVKIISVIMAITLVGKLLGLVREVIVGAVFGSVGDGAALNLASTLPRDFLDIAFASAISGCFIPVFNSTLEKEGREKAYSMANSFITIIIVSTTVITFAAMFFSSQIAVLMGPGYPAKVQTLSGELFKITLPLIILSGAAFSLIGVLQSLGEFNIPAAMSIISNGIIILYCLFLTPYFGVRGAAAAFLLGWVAQIIVQIPALKKINYKFRFSFDFSHGGLREISAMMLPVMASTWTQPINNMVNVRISTYINESASVAYVKANMLYSVITGVFVLSIANYVFPELTKINARDDEKGFGETLRAVLRGLLFFLIPMTVGLFILSKPLARLIFQVGKYDEFAANLTALALSYFSLGMLGFGMQTILSRAFYAQKNANVPLFTGIAAVLTNACLSTLLIKPLGVGGVALSSSVSFTLIAAIMLVFMYKKNKFILDIHILRDTLFIIISSLAMGIVVRVLYVNLNSILSHGALWDIVRIGVPTVAGVLFYVLLSSFFKIQETKIIFNLLGKFRK